MRQSRPRHQSALLWTPIAAPMLVQAAKLRIRTTAILAHGNGTGHVGIADGKTTLYLCRRAPNLSTGEPLNL